MIDSVNYSLSAKTKGVYNTAARKLDECRLALKEPMTLPLTERDILMFIGFNFRKGNKVGTVRSYLAGIKKYHLAMGYTNFEYFSPLVKEVLEGQGKKIEVEGAGKLPTRKYGKKCRLPCTPTILSLIKVELKNSSLTSEEKVLAWAGSSLAFFGAFRPGELLCDHEKEFAPCDSLLKSDINLCEKDDSGRESVTIRLKNSKTKKGKAEVVTVYATGDQNCPVRAVKKLLAITKNNPNDIPIFCDSKGHNFTTGKFNKILKLLTEKHFKHGKISGHSFRQGLISHFAKLGHSDSDLKRIGGWSSRAFLVYIKLGRTRRHEMAVQASKI